MYKILNFVLTGCMYGCLNDKQKGCKRVLYKCKDQHLFNKMIFDDC